MMYFFNKSVHLMFM